MNRRVLITGATGFVGGYLLADLQAEGADVWGTSFPAEPDPETVSGCQDICLLDLRDSAGVYDLCRSSQPDWIFHLAAVASVGYSWHNRAETLQTNLLGTLNILEAARIHVPHAKILFVSSSNVYGETGCAAGGLREETEVRALSPYAYSKISGEMLCRFYHDVEGLSVLIARSFPHTGPGQSPDFVCSDWASQIAAIEKGRAEPVIKTGDIAVQRDFTDVRDVVRAYTMLMHKGRAGQTYNIASGEAIALSAVLDILLAMTDADITVRTDPAKLRKAEIPCLLGNNQKITSEIGWQPEIPIRQTLSDLLTYWRAKV